MNILLLCTKFSINEEDGWLTNDLANAFAKMGHSVCVICVDWSDKTNQPPKTYITSTGVKVTVMSTLSIQVLGAKIEKITKWLFSSLAARKCVKKEFRNIKFDLIIGFSPAVTMMAPLLTSLRQPGVKSSYILWDFFPYHHRQIGLIKNRFVFLGAKKIEEYITRKFDFIGCMTQKNVDYLKQHYNLKKNQQVGILPLWGNTIPVADFDKSLMRENFGLSGNKVIAIFGGQLTVGRGIEDILAVAKMAQQSRDSIVFLFIGSGPYEALIQDEIANGAKNVVLLKPVPRNRYLQLLSACDIALVCTVRDVDVPTFPSKTIDYFKASLPIVASVEASSDYGEWLETWKAGLCSEAGNLNAFYENVKKLSLDPDARHIAGKNGNDCFKKEMDVSVVCGNLLKNIGF